MKRKGDRNRRYWLFLTGVLLWAAGGFAQAGENGQIRVASWNVRNYLIMDRWVENRYRTEYPKPEKEKQAMWEILREVDPDILLIQEMGDTPFLLELQRDLKREGLDYPHALLTEDTADPVRRLAVLSKIPWEQARTHSNLEFRYYGEPSRVLRGTLELVMEGYEKPLVLFTLHLKSRYTNNQQDPQSLQRRRGEARVTRDRIFSRYRPEQNHWVLIAGDFNDHPNSSPVKHFLQRGKTTLMERLPLQDSRGERWTHFYAYQENYSTVDHILVSPALQPYVVEGRGHIYDRQPHTRIASDHRLIWVDLQLPEKQTQ